MLLTLFADNSVVKVVIFLKLFMALDMSILNELVVKYAKKYLNIVRYRFICLTSACVMHDQIVGLLSEINY